MDEYESLSHTKWDCKYHVVFIPKYRRKVLYEELRRHLGDVFRKLALQKESRIEEGHLMLDHVHMMISVPPKYAVSQVKTVWLSSRDPRAYAPTLQSGRPPAPICAATQIAFRLSQYHRRW